MNFRDEMVNEKGAIMTSRERIAQEEADREKYREEDIEKSLIHL